MMAALSFKNFGLQKYSSPWRIFLREEEFGSPHSKARGIVEKGRIGAVFSMAWAVAKQLAAVSLSPSIDSITSPRLYQET